MSRTQLPAHGEHAIGRGPSAHLTWAELGCRNGTPYPERWRASRAVALAHEFEAIRALCGNVPLRVTSAYRPPAYNAQVGGAEDSQHLHGRALDIAPLGKVTLAQLQTAALRRAEDPDSLIRGIGFYSNGSVHIDIRPTTGQARWGMEHRIR